MERLDNSTKIQAEMFQIFSSQTPRKVSLNGTRVEGVQYLVALEECYDRCREIEKIATNIENTNQSIFLPFYSKLEHGGELN